MLRKVCADDAPCLSDIYNHYVEHTTVTFEEAPLVPEVMQSRIQETTKSYPWLVCEEDGMIVGYGYATRWRERAAYRHSVEVSVYLHHTATGKGRGSLLLDALLTELRGRNFHCVMGGVALPNPASIALLERFGLRQVAHFREVGCKFDRRIDVGYWQLLL